MELGATGTDQSKLAYAGFLGLNEDLIYGGGYGISDSGEMGVYAQLSGTIGDGFSASIDYDGNTAQVAPERNDFPLVNPELSPSPTPTPNIAQINLLERKSDRINATLQKQSGNFSYRLIGSSFTDTLGDRTYRYGPDIIWRAIADTRDSLTFEVSYLFTQDGPEAIASVSYQHRFLPWTAEVQSGFLNNSDRQQIQARPILSYQDTNRANRGLTGRVSTLVAQDSKDGSSIFDDDTAELRHIGERFEVGGTVAESNLSSSKRKTAVSGLIGTSLVVASDGSASISSPSGLQGVLIADVEGNAGSEVTLLLDGAPYAKIPVGTRSPVGIGPYRRYTVTIRPSESSELVRVDDQKYEITVFPGTVITRHWRADRVFIIVGRVVDDTGKPIAHVRIRGPKEYVVTDERGLFQAEVTGAESLSIDAPSVHCVLQVPRLETKEYLMELGDVVCSDKGSKS